MISENHSWLELWQSHDRWAKYLVLANGSNDQALNLYELNSRLASALMHDIAHFEVALRNRYDAVISENHQGVTHWLLDPESPVNQPLIRMRGGREVDLNDRNRTAISEAIRRTRQSNPSPGKIIPELSFGFWRHLTDAAHERTLWMTYLMWAFPPGTGRKDVEKHLANINHVRNRVSHHEFLLGDKNLQKVEESHVGLQQIVDMLLPDLARHISNTSAVTSTINLIRSELT